MKKQPNILILNGPNLNMLGVREPALYGKTTLAELEKTVISHGKALGLNVTCEQSNHEGELIDLIHAARGTAQAIIINAGAYTHTSLALHDALLATELPVMEVHLSNVFAREEFRHHSFISPIAKGVICGFGIQGYVMALDAIAALLKGK